MAARYPEALWRPLAPTMTQPRMSTHDIVCLHTMVGSLWGTDSYFHQSGYVGSESHFGVGHDGETIQWVDLDYTADANLDGRYRVISIETADYGIGFPTWNTGDGSAVPAWTGAQIDRLVHLVDWLCDLYSIPKVAIPDSKPGRRGIGWHRQGVDSSPLYQAGYRVSGGERWSSSLGKVCPGWRRIEQIPTIIDRLGGEEEDMPITDADAKKVADSVYNRIRDLLPRAFHSATTGDANMAYNAKVFDTVGQKNYSGEDPFGSGAWNTAGGALHEVSELHAALLAVNPNSPTGLTMLESMIADGASRAVQAWIGESGNRGFTQEQVDTFAAMTATGIIHSIVTAVNVPVEEPPVEDPPA